MNTTLIGIAGVHHIVSELSRRGLVALPTVKNTAAYDIVALNESGRKHANIQVKTSSKRVGFFPMPAAHKIRRTANDYYIFARWLKTESRYECFLLTGKQTFAEVNRMLQVQRRAIANGTRRVEFPCVEVSKRNAKSALVWQKAWDKWRF